MKVKYYWTHDGTGEVCEYENATTPNDIQCYHCNNPILNGNECVKLTTLDGDVYWLHEHCAKDSVDFKE